MPRKYLPQDAKAATVKVTPPQSRLRMKHPIQSPPHSPTQFEENGKDDEEVEDSGPKKENDEGKIVLMMRGPKLKKRVGVSLVTT